MGGTFNDMSPRARIIERIYRRLLQETQKPWGDVAFGGLRNVVAVWQVQSIEDSIGASHKFTGSEGDVLAAAGAA